MHRIELMELTKKTDIQKYLKSIGCKTSFKTRTDAQAFLKNLSWTETFPWNTDQQSILRDAQDDAYNELVIQGCFGAGKTTIMTGILTRHVISSASPVLLCAFNVSIRNELKRKSRELGFKRRPVIRTFDSLIYQICRAFDMEHLDRPDYEGRRTFVEHLLMKNELGSFTVFHAVQVVLIDEAQDLDQKAYDVFKAVCPNARILFFGDVFQCIQKEPRCSLLWNLLQKEKKGRKVYFMKLTPRVPTPILEEIKTALIRHYPQYSQPISEWYSTNPLTDEGVHRIEWRPLKHYTDAFRACKEFIATYPQEDCMILTFSSAITVRGSMGDLSRVRQFLLQEKIEVNKNYKAMEPGKLFLSTANSSKGLERKHVLVILTFPLELAFANFSDDLVVNLVSVGLSRCKETVEFCVPIYSDRYSRVLNLYQTCPRPTSTTDLPAAPKTVSDYLEQSHSTTEIIRQGILSFQTRQMIRSLARFVPTTQHITGERVKWGMRNEEEASFMGVLYEVLITSLWTQKWPPLDTGGMTTIQNNPMYAHCKNGISKKFNALIRRFYTPFHEDFNVLFEYTEFHILLTQKIRVRVTPERKQEMKNVWTSIRQDILNARPALQGKAQVNLQRPFITGIADMICKDDTNIVLYEFKTCSQCDWKDDAFIQAALYMSMTQKRMGAIRLFNPFRKEIIEYNISFLSKEKNKVIEMIDRELLLWNTNCFLAKFQSICTDPPTRKLPFPIGECVCTSGDASVEWLASTKIRMTPHQPTSTKHIISFDTKDPFLREWYEIPEGSQLTEWILSTIGFQHNEERTRIDWEDPFSQAILIVCLIRCTFSFS